MFLAALVTIVGVPSTAGAAHPPTVFGYHVMWSTGTVFLFGIVVGAVALLELIMLVAGARSLTRRRYDARSALATASNGKSGSSNRRLDTRFKHQRWADSTDVRVLTRARQRWRGSPRWRRGSPHPQPTDTARDGNRK